MLLDSVNKSIKVVLEAAKTANDCPVTAFYVDHTAAGGTPGSNDAATNGTTPITVVAAPAAATQRQVKMITVYNADTAAVTVYTQFVNGATTRIMNKSTLAVGEALVYQNEIGFRVTQETFPDFLQPSDLSIEAVTKDLQVDIQSMPSVTGAVTTDALKASNLNIDTAEKLLEVSAIVDILSKLLFGTVGRIFLDPSGRIHITTSSGAIVSGSIASGAIASGAIASGAIASGAIAASAFAVGAVRAGGFAAGALATGAITDLPYSGYDHEANLSQIAWNGIRDRMEFTG